MDKPILYQLRISLAKMCMCVCEHVPDAVRNVRGS